HTCIRLLCRVEACLLVSPRPPHCTLFPYTTLFRSEMSEADWDRMLAINAKAVFFLSQLVLPGMRERRRGAVVNLASVAGKIATRSEEHTSELQSRVALVCRFLLEQNNGVGLGNAER